MATKRKSAGRPSEYSASHAQTAYKLTLLGCTDIQIAAALGVSEQTLNSWKQSHPEFLESIKKGKENADGEVSASLWSRAMGYSHADVDIRTVSVGDGCSQIVQTPIVKHYPPDTTACIFWLKNRQPKLWRDVQRHEVTGKDGGKIQIEQMSADELRLDMIKRGEMTPDGRLIPQRN